MLSTLLGVVRCVDGKSLKSEPSDVMLFSTVVHRRYTLEYEYSSASESNAIIDPVYILQWIVPLWILVSKDITFYR